MFKSDNFSIYCYKQEMLTFTENWQMKIKKNSLKKHTHGYVIHTWSDIEHCHLCMEGHLKLRLWESLTFFWLSWTYQNHFEIQNILFGIASKRYKGFFQTLLDWLCITDKRIKFHVSSQEKNKVFLSWKEWWISR